MPVGPGLAAYGDYGAVRGPIEEETLPSGVPHGDTGQDIARLTDPTLTAVIVASDERPGRLDELTELVVARQLVIPRTTLTAVSRDEFADWSRTALADTDKRAGISRQRENDTHHRQLSSVTSRDGAPAWRSGAFRRVRGYRS
ncbi:hypothetical protein AB0K93_09605 [Streptomyces sp. NPDC052676]|uniref:hypothetical protein n=1 Tax=Streptomyces sp. NPDC052676 TaxID=3154953 RepID=UPI00342055F2